jgi:hypothetical protein
MFQKNIWRKTMKKTLVIVAAALLAAEAGLFASGGRPDGSQAGSKSGGTDTAGPLKINYVAETRGFTYTHSTPLALPDGTVIKAGDLKPFWQYVQKELGVQLQEVTSQNTANEIIQTQAATGFKDANIYGGNSVANDLMNYGVQGYFVDLNKYLAEMPNFKKYLDSHGNIKNAITAYDGGIYFLPYIAEIGYYARAFMGRTGWVSLLLDGGAVENETASLTVAYQPFWTGTNARNAQNVVTLQNAAAQGGRLGFAQARTTLINYIKQAYPSLAKPSDLYLGPNAQYDIDELVALWRVVRLGPNTLSKAATGAVVPNAEIVPYFPRQTSYREDLLRLANYFNGQRVFGSDSYDARFYLDAKGTLQFSYNEPNFQDNILPELKAMYTEGLVAPDFAALNLKDNFRTIYFGGDIKAGNTKFGFMTFDFIPSTTSVSLGSGKVQEGVEGILPPVTKIPGVESGWVHYMENTRVIKPDGWAISSVTGGQKLKDALKLFDWFFSAAGSQANNFGWTATIDPGAKYTAPDGQVYPSLSKWFNDEAAKVNQDGALFSRNFLGFNFPIGYEKSIGFEQQFTTPLGEKTWKLYNDAKVLSSTYDTVKSPYYSLVPPVFSFTEQQLRQLLDTNIGSTQVDLIFNYITTNATTVQQIKDSYKNGKADAYIQAYRDAYAAVSKK